MAPAPSKGPLHISASPTPRTISVLAKVKGAKEVILSGVFNGWAKDRIKMHQIHPDQWRADLVLAPGEYQYRLIVDGKWQDHLEASRRVPNPFGTQNCVLSVFKK